MKSTERSNLQMEVLALLSQPMPDDHLRILKNMIILFTNDKSTKVDGRASTGVYSEFIRLLNSHDDKFFCIREYSDLIKVSPRQLNKIIKEASGKTTCEVISGKMINKAKHLLSDTGLSVKEIAARMGFADQYYFSRFFKKYTGMAPKYYRAEHAGVSIKK